MILLLACVGTILAGIFVALHTHRWPFFLLGIGYKHDDGDIAGPRLLTAHHGPPPWTPPAIDHVSETIQRVDLHRFVAVTQALQVVRSENDTIPVESLTIIVPLVLSLVLTRLCRCKGRRLSPTTSVDSDISCRNSSTMQLVFGVEEAGSRLTGGHTLRRYGVGRRRSPPSIPSVDFPALAGYEPGESAGSDKSTSGSQRQQRSQVMSFVTASEEQLFAVSSASHTRQQPHAGGRLKGWIRDVVLDTLCDYLPAPRRPVLDDFSFWEDRYSTARALDASPNRQASFHNNRDRDDCRRGDRAARADADVFDTCLVEELYCRRSDARESGKDETEVVEQNDVDADQSLPEPLDSRPKHRNQNELSDVNISVLSAETVYLEPFDSEFSPKEVPSAASFDVRQQDAWCSAVAAVAPIFDSPVEPTQAPLPSPLQSQDVFDQLLNACRQTEAVSFSDVLQGLGVESCVKLHESEHADIFRFSGARCEPTVLKVFDCNYIAMHSQCLCNEINISWLLNCLAKGTENQTSGFCQLEAAHCTWERYPELLESACTSYNKKQLSAISRHGGTRLLPPYAVFRMPFAGKDFSKVKFDNALQLRSVVQQLALTIAIGEAEVEFEHRALTARHVLVKAARGRVARFRIMNNSVYIDLHGFKATIVDFASSRLCAGTGSVPIYTELDEQAEEKKRAVGERFDLIITIIRPNAAHFHPYTNVVFLHDLLHGLLETYEPVFESNRYSWTAPEQEAWKDLALWSEEISVCSGAMDFVVARVLRSVRFEALPREDDED